MMKGLILEKLSEKIGNTSVLIVLVITIFAVPVIPDAQLWRIIFSVMLTIVFFMGVLAMENMQVPHRSK